jgi:hypothetical protein
LLSLENVTKRSACPWPETDSDVLENGKFIKSICGVREKSLVIKSDCVAVSNKLRMYVVDSNATQNGLFDYLKKSDLKKNEKYFIGGEKDSNK